MFSTYNYTEEKCDKCSKIGPSTMLEIRTRQYRENNQVTVCLKCLRKIVAQLESELAANAAVE